MLVLHHRLRFWAPAVLGVVLVGSWLYWLRTDPPPGGTIHFGYDEQVWAMSGDGTGRVPVLPNGWFGEPSGRSYGGTRWWLTTATVETPPDPDHPAGVHELFAFRHNPATRAVDRVQLTELARVGSAWPWQVAPPDIAQPRWSNDGRDTFVSFAAGRSGHVWLGNVIPARLFRLRLTPAEIEGIAAGRRPPVRNPAELEPILDVPYAGPPWGYSWSRDGGAVAYTYYHGGHHLKVWDVAAGCDVTAVAVEASTPRMSPAGDRVAFTRGEAGVWVMNVDGTGLQAAGGNGTSDPAWSPDGRHLAFRLKRPSGGHPGYEYAIYRATADGAAATYLTGYSVGTRFRGLCCWLADTDAP